MLKQTASVFIMASVIACVISINGCEETRGSGGTPPTNPLGKDAAVIAPLVATTQLSAVQEKLPDIYTTLTAQGAPFTSLVKAIETAGLVDTLRGNQVITLFAPTDEAFSKLAPGKLDDLLRPENRSKLLDLLQYHMMTGTCRADLMTSTRSAMSLNNKSIVARAMDGKVMINDATVVKRDVECGNGAIQWIDTVLQPPR